MAQGFEHVMDFAWEAHYASSDNRINIDLHRAIVPDFFRIPKDFINHTALEFSLETRFLLLCLQLVKDCCHWRLQLGQLCDLVKRLSSQPDLDLNEVQHQAQLLGCHRILWTTLQLISKNLR